MNKAFFIGNLTRDPELTETESGIIFCRASLAVNRIYASADGEKKADFFNIVAWRGLGETLARYAKKGNKIAVSGYVQIRVWEDSDGVKRQSVDIVAQDIEFLTPKERQDEGAPASRPQQMSMDGTERPSSRLQAFDDDSDIPF